MSDVVLIKIKGIVNNKNFKLHLNHDGKMTYAKQLKKQFY